MNQQLSALLEGLAWEEFREAKLPERFRGKVAVVIPAYNEAASVGDVIRRIPEEVCGEPTAVLVVDDGSRDDTSEEAAKAGAIVARHVINRGGGAAVRTGYRLMAESGALVVVTLDADGQHLPSEMERLVKPVLDDEVDVAHGSRVLGEAEPNAHARELRDRLLQQARLLHHPDEGLRLLERLPGRSDHGPPPARPPPGAVPHLGVPDRGDQARDPREGGPGDRGQARPRPLEEARRGALRARLRERNRPDLAQVGRSAGPGPDLGGVRQVEVGPAARADLDVELEDLAAGRTAALGLLPLAAIEDRRDQAEDRDHGPDQRARSRTSSPSPDR